jgi:opacity protein-like surface antigen
MTSVNPDVTELTPFGNWELKQIVQRCEDVATRSTHSRDTARPASCTRRRKDRRQQNKENKMRRRIVANTLLAIALSVGASAAYAQAPTFYISGEGGVSLLPDLTFKDTLAGKLSDSFDTGFAAGGAFGYDTGDGIRVELDSLYQHSDVGRLGGVLTNGHLSSTSLMINTTYDFLPNAKFTPYVGAGLGFQNVGGTIGTLSGRDWRPAYQAEAGLRTYVSDNVSLFGEYRFSQSESVTLSTPTDSAHQHFSDHALLAGLSFDLN